MKHKHAGYIKAWVEDSESVQYRHKWGGGWITVTSASIFDYPEIEFRHTPKPVCYYMVLYPQNGYDYRQERTNAKATFVEGKLTAVELLKEGDGL